MPSTLPSSIPDSQLGLSQSELHILRQHQQIALSSGSSSAAPHYAHSTTSSRGRGHARSSASTSRAASAASSGQGGGGRLLLDAGSLAVLGSHFERLMGAIQSRVNHVRLFFPQPCPKHKPQPCLSSFSELDRSTPFFASCSVRACSSLHSSRRKPNAPPSTNRLAPSPPLPPPTLKSPAFETSCARLTTSRPSLTKCAIYVTSSKAAVRGSRGYLSDILNDWYSLCNSWALSALSVFWGFPLRWILGHLFDLYPVRTD